MRAAMLGTLMLGLAVAGLGIAQPLPRPAVPNAPTPMERFVTWVRTPPKAAQTRRQRSEGVVVELPAAPAPGESVPPSLPAPPPNDDPFAPPVSRTASGPATATSAPLALPAASALNAPAASATPGAGSAAPAPSASTAAPVSSAASAESAPSANRLTAWLRPGTKAPAKPDASLSPPAAGSDNIVPMAGVEAPPKIMVGAMQAPALPAPPPEAEAAPLPNTLPPPTPVQPELPQVTPTPGMVLEPTLGFNDEVFIYDSPGSCWTSVEYLMWRTLHAPLAYPLVTSTITGTGTGVPNSANTQTFFDKGSMSYPWYSGLRVTTGMWLDSAERTGLEASGFFVNTPGIHFSVVANSAQPAISGPAGPQGTIAIYQPFINSVSGAASAQTIGAQTFSQGFINIDSTSNLNGADVNLVRNVYRGPICRVELLGGYRYLNLKEELNITTNTNASGTTTALTSPNQYMINDNFITRNQFNGGQLGARAVWIRDCFRCSVSGKLALGVTQENGQIFGNTAFLSNAAPVVTNSGFYAQTSNTGSYTREQFAAVPQLGITLGYQAGSHCYFYFGYDMLYWTRVARPGDMLNPLLNPASIPSNPSFTGAISTQPAPLFLSRDFWAQGVDMGVEVKY